MTRSWKDEVHFDEAGALEEAKRMGKAMKRQENMNKNKSNTNLDNCVLLLQNGCRQLNEWKHVVFKETTYNNVIKNGIARIIRKKCGDLGWDCRTTDKSFQRIK